MAQPVFVDNAIIFNASPVENSGELSSSPPPLCSVSDSSVSRFGTPALSDLSLFSSDSQSSDPSTQNLSQVGTRRSTRISKPPRRFSIDFTPRKSRRGRTICRSRKR
jgi:hypothetical protein